MLTNKYDDGDDLMLNVRKKYLVTCQWYFFACINFISTENNIEVHSKIEYQMQQNVTLQTAVHVNTKFPRLYRQSGYRCR